ncbi:hypothetical protein AgCh_022094 [Apium graveolens]
MVFTQFMRDFLECVSLLSALKQRPDPPTGFSKLTVLEAKKAIDLLQMLMLMWRIWELIPSGQRERVMEINLVNYLFIIRNMMFVGRDETGIVIGVTVTISKVISALKEKLQDGLCSDKELIFTKIVDHVVKIASEPVHNLASVEGNVVMAQRYYFPSDIVTLLLAISSTLDLLIHRKREILALENFSSLDHRGVLFSIKIPFSSSYRSTFTTESSKLVFETYRAPRPLGNALPYINTAILAIISRSRIGVVINKIQLVFGTFGAKHAKRAREAEKYLAGKIISSNVLYDAINIIRATVISEDGTSDAMYRTSLNYANNLADGDNLSKDATKPALLSSGKQLLKTSREYYPVGQPIVKSGASLQASG